MKISLVVSTYNEVLGIEEFYNVTKKELDSIKNIKYEILFVNDGSSDGTLEKLENIAKKDKMVKIINFSRNFGHEAAMTAGVDYASGDVIIFMDADLQHPPRLIKDILSKVNEGYDVITMVRKENKSAGLIKNITSNGFYYVINKLSDASFQSNVSDFFAITSKVNEVLKENYRNKVRFLRGYIQNVGFKKANILYEADTRFAGESHYSISKLFKFSISTLVYFSNVPLKLGIYLGNITVLSSLIYLIVTLFNKTILDGYNILLIIILFLFGLLFYLIGIVGNYLAVLFREIKDYPIYVVDNTINMN